jgi:hypothetical protein
MAAVPDRRALPAQSALAVVVLLVSYFLAPAPPPPAAQPSAAVNINYVYGLDDQQAQTLMAPGLWLGLVIGVNLAVFYVPAHLLLRRIAGVTKDTVEAARPSW